MKAHLFFIGILLLQQLQKYNRVFEVENGCKKML